jgi:hypothetical protein
VNAPLASASQHRDLPAPTPQFCAEAFDREMYCSESDWLGRVQRALAGRPYRQVAQALTATLDSGQLVLSWRLLAPAGAVQPASPRLLVSFRFSGLDALQRHRFMQRLDSPLRTAL